MQRRQLYKIVITALLKEYSGLSEDEDDYKDISDYLDNNNLTDALEKIKTLSVYQGKLETIIDKLLDVCSNADDEDNILSQEVNSHKYKIEMHVVHKDLKYKRDLVYQISGLFIVEYKMLSKIDMMNDRYWRYVEIILVDPKRTKSFFNILNSSNTDEAYIVIYNKSMLGIASNEQVDLDKLYSYALASKINDREEIDIHTDLLLSPINAPVLSSFEYKNDVVYQEYYDIYDGINDWLHSKDIITAFLKMYQIAEYMIYRMQLAEIINGAELKQSFLREVKSLNQKYSLQERNTITENFPKLFSGITLDPSDINFANPFIDKYFGKAKSGHSYLNVSPTDFDKAVARFVYDVRCSIVHNKEAEFHILYNNYSIYSSIIPLMKSINEQVITKVMTIITSSNSTLHFTKKDYPMY